MLIYAFKNNLRRNQISIKKSIKFKLIKLVDENNKLQSSILNKIQYLINHDNKLF